MYSSFNGVLDATGRNTTVFTVIRHPVDRFLSGFVDKCKKYCEYHQHKTDLVFIKYDMKPNPYLSIAHDLDKVFSLVDVPSKERSIIQSELLKGKVAHSTSGSKLRAIAERQLLSSNYLMKLLIQIYKSDFIEFYSL
ncbi:hypothetical protein Q1695_012448 [Nippostrongylus brasiliensis]|nr:hypothetical protein Q1695_012448 [Nippostrongylus brasiliensis]